MDYLNLSDDFLKKANRFCRYDKKIPFQYRIVAKLIYDETDYHTARSFILANRDAFNDEYNYLLLDTAVEHSADAVVDENGKYYYDLRNLPAVHTYKPIKECMDFIRFLLENGADPKLPAHSDQMTHIAELEGLCDYFEPDLSELKELLKRYM